jgi:hypothetical protein
MLYRNLPADLTQYQMIEIVNRLLVTMTSGPPRSFFNIFHFRNTSNAGAVNMQNIVDAFATNFTTAILPTMNARAAQADAVARPLDDPSSLGATSVIGAGNPGGVATDSYDMASAVSIDLLTDGRGRSFRGRKHFAPLSEADTTGDELTGGGLTAWQAVAGYMASPWTIFDGISTVVTLTVLSRQLSVLSGPSIAFTGADVVNAICQPIVGTMRKRKERTSHL